MSSSSSNDSQEHLFTYLTGTPDPSRIDFIKKIHGINPNIDVSNKSLTTLAEILFELMPFETLEQDLDIDCPMCNQYHEREISKHKSRKKTMEKILKKIKKGTVLKTFNKISVTIDVYLGEGGEAVVYKGNITDENVAIKIGDIYHEIPFLLRLRKIPNIIQILGFGKVPSIPDIRFIVLPLYCASLSDQYVKRNKSFLIIAMKEIAKAVDEIHNNNILHRDISPSNILVCKRKSEYSIVLSDFGFAQYYVPPREIRTYKRYQHEGKIDYMSFEQHEGYRYNSFRTDYQAYFYVLYSFFLHLPWEIDIDDDDGAKIYKMKKKFKPRIFRSLYKKIWKIEFGEQVNFEKLVEPHLSR